jgi:nitroreductase
MRKYKEKEVSDQMLTRLNEYARFSPTGSNAEGTKIIFVKSKEKREKLTKALMGFWFKLEKIATFPPIKWIAGFFTSRKRLNMRLGMLKNFTSKFKQGHDSLFYNAPVIAFLYTEKDSASTPKDDCCYALFSMALGAQTMGLSSCINQLAVISFEKSKKKIRKILGLSKNQTIRACATFGYPAFEYKRTVFRKQLVPEIK